MLSLALALVAAAPGPSVEKAHALVSQKAWEDLYLAFAAADPKGYDEKDRITLGAELARGCGALLGRDAVMAFSLGERASAFAPSAAGLLCAGRAAKATDQRGAAEQTFRSGLATFPDEGAFGLELGKFLLEDKDGAGAAVALEKVPKRARQYKEAQKLLKTARSSQMEDSAARKQVQTIESKIDKGESTASVAALTPGTPVPPGGAGKRTGSLTYESGVGPDGMRTRGNSRFLIKYFNHDRDFGQRADYEGKVVGALDEAYAASKQILGVAREAPCDVILYSREEFGAHFSAAAAHRVAGLYAMSAIRMNDAVDISAQSKATLVHEYVHAVVDDQVGGQSGRLPHWLNEGLAEYVEWRYMGEDPPGYIEAMLVGAAKGKHVPSLAMMDRGAPINEGNPAVAYGFSTMAVETLLKNGGVDNLLGLIHEVGRGAPFEPTLVQRYGKTVAQLQEMVTEDLAGR
ncbi:MAG TPA: hypothetical protein VH208_10200 [Myxococcaceae bacterium]|nr:hypothetical protein [Myxococcaceae bacterium]